MADEPDFTFDAGTKPEMSALVPLYTHILGHSKAKTKLSLGSVTRAVAEAWLVERHDAYRELVGEKRSPLIYKMDILSRVELVGLTDPPPT